MFVPIIIYPKKRWGTILDISVGTTDTNKFFEATALKKAIDIYDIAVELGAKNFKQNFDPKNYVDINSLPNSHNLKVKFVIRITVIFPNIESITTFISKAQEYANNEATFD